MTVIITESLSCMTPELCRINNTFLMPFDCYVNGKKYSDRITNEVSPPKDSYSRPPAPEAYDRVFRRFIEAGSKVICITTSRKISGAYESAVTAAEEFPSDRLCVVDSGTAAGGLYLMVKHIREHFPEDISIGSAVEKLENYKSSINVKFTANDSDRLTSFNRLDGAALVKPAVGKKPVFVIKDGSILYKTSASPGAEEIAELVSEFENPGHLILHYLERNAYLRKVGSELKKKCPNVKIYTLPITLSLKINLGTSIIGIVGD